MKFLEILVQENRYTAAQQNLARSFELRQHENLLAIKQYMTGHNNAPRSEKTMRLCLERADEKYGL